MYDQTSPFAEFETPVSQEQVEEILNKTCESVPNHQELFDGLGLLS